MNFTPFPEISTPRLILREPKLEDWPVISFLRTDKEVNKYVRRSSAANKKAATEFIQKCLLDISKNKLINWFICLKEDRRMIGTICLWNFSPNRKIAEVGYDLHTTFQGFGLMHEAMEAVIQFGFAKIDLKMIEAFTNSANAKSINLLKRNQFQLNNDRRDHDDPDNMIYELYNANLSD